MKWALKTELVRKEGKNMRLLVHYQMLNTMIIRNWYQILRMDECDQLGDATIYLTLESNSVYWQLKNVA